VLPIKLSRRDEDKETQAIPRPFWPDIAEINEEAKKDPILTKIGKKI